MDDESGDDEKDELTSGRGLTCLYRLFTGTFHPNVRISNVSNQWQLFVLTGQKPIKTGATQTR